MRLGQVITDYIRRSILTAKGDLVVRGDSQPENLAAGIVGTVLKGAGVGEIPAWGVPSISEIPFDIVWFDNYDSGNLVTSALSFPPKLIIFLARDHNAAYMNYSWGIATPAFNISHRIQNDGGDQLDSGARSVYIRRSAGNEAHGIVSVWAADGFTVSMIWTGTVSIDLHCICFG